MHSLPGLQRHLVQREDLVQAGVLDEEHLPLDDRLHLDHGRGRQRGSLDVDGVGDAGAEAHARFVHVLKGRRDEDGRGGVHLLGVVDGLVALVLLVGVGGQDLGVLDC